MVEASLAQAIEAVYQYCRTSVLTPLGVHTHLHRSVLLKSSCIYFLLRTWVVTCFCCTQLHIYCTNIPPGKFSDSTCIYMTSWNCLQFVQLRKKEYGLDNLPLNLTVPTWDWHFRRTLNLSLNVLINMQMQTSNMLYTVIGFVGSSMILCREICSWRKLTAKCSFVRAVFCPVKLNTRSLILQQCISLGYFPIQLQRFSLWKCIQFRPKIKPLTHQNIPYTV